MYHRQLIKDILAWEAGGVPIHLALNQKVTVTHDTTGIAGAPLARLHTTRAGYCTNAGDQVMTVREVMTAAAGPTQGRDDAMIEACVWCGETDEGTAALFNLLRELGRAAVVAADVNTGLDTLTAAASADVPVDRNRLHLLLLNRAEVEFPARAGNSPRVATYATGTLLRPWWDERVPAWRKALTAVVTQLRARQDGWSGPLHLVAPTMPLGRAGVGRDELLFPDPGTLLEHVACAPLAGVIPWHGQKHSPVFAVPAAVAQAGSGNTLWADLGPAETVPDLPLLLTAYANTFAHQQGSTELAYALRTALAGHAPA